MRTNSKSSAAIPPQNKHARRHTFSLSLLQRSTLGGVSRQSSPCSQHCRYACHAKSNLRKDVAPLHCTIARSKHFFFNSSGPTTCNLSANIIKNLFAPASKVVTARLSLCVLASWHGGIKQKRKFHHTASSGIFKYPESAEWTTFFAHRKHHRHDVTIG